MSLPQAVLPFPIRIPLLTTALLLCIHSHGIADTEPLRFAISQAEDTGTMRYSDDAAVIWKKSKLDLAKLSLDAGPLGLQSYPLNDKTWLLWGWSSQGGGEETHHLFLIRASDDQLTLADQIIVTAPRGTSFISIETKEGNADILLVGSGFEEIRLQGAHFKERALNGFATKPAGEDVLKGKKQWWAPYLLQSRRPTTLRWQLPIEVKNDRFVAATKSKQ